MAGELAQDGARRSSPLRPRIGSARIHGEAGPILLMQLEADPFTHCPSTVLAEIVVEVGNVRHE